MRAPKWLKFVGYPSWFIAVFVVSFFLTFPTGVLRTTIIDNGEKMLGRGKQGRNGVDPSVEFAKVDLWRLSGLAFERVHLRFGSRNPDPGPEVDIDELRVRATIMSLLFGSPEFTFDGKLYGGTVEGRARLANEKLADDRMFGEWRSLIEGKLDPMSSIDVVELKVDGVKLERIPALVKLAKGIPVAGTLKLDANLELGPEPGKNGAGKIDLDIAKVQVGPGELNLMGTFAIPLVDGGDFQCRIEINNGRGKTNPCRLGGRDLVAEVDSEVGLSKRLNMSRVSGGGWFQLQPDFLKENGKFKAILFDFPGPQKRAKDDQDRFHFNLRGSLFSPGFTLSASAGKDKRKSSRSRSRSRRSPKKKK